MPAMVAPNVKCWQCRRWWRKKFNAGNAGDGGEKCLMLAMVAKKFNADNAGDGGENCNAGDGGKKNVILTMPAMVAPNVKCWQCRRWWRKKLNGGEKV